MLVSFLPAHVAHADCTSTPTGGPSTLDDSSQALTIRNGESEDQVTYTAKPPLPCGANVSAELGSDVHADGGGKLDTSKVLFNASVTQAGDLRIRATVVKGANLDGGKYTSAVSVTGVSITNAPTIEIDRKDYTKALLTTGLTLLACLAVFFIYRTQFAPPDGASSKTAAQVVVVVAAVVGLLWVGVASLVYFPNNWAANQTSVGDLFAKSVVGYGAGVSFVGGLIKAKFSGQTSGGS